MQNIVYYKQNCLKFLALMHIQTASQVKHAYEEKPFQKEER